MKTLCKILHDGGLAAVLALGMGFMAGCTTLPETPRVLNTPNGRWLTVGFVFEEDIYAVGPSFSLADLYWRYFFPQAATAFRESRRFDSYDEALRADVDLVVVGEATVHGARKGFKMTLEIVALSLDEDEMMRHGFHERVANEETAELVFESLGKQAATLLTQSRKLRSSHTKVIQLTP